MVTRVPSPLFFRACCWVHFAFLPVRRRQYLSCEHVGRPAAPAARPLRPARPDAVRFAARHRPAAGAPPPRLRVSGRPAVPPPLGAPQPALRLSPRPGGRAVDRPRPRGRSARPRKPAEAPAGDAVGRREAAGGARRSEEHTSELQSLMRISYAVFCLTKKKYQ